MVAEVLLHCTWAWCIEQRLPLWGSCRGELLLACFVALKILFACLQDVLEVLGCILQAQPQAVHNGVGVATALLVGGLGSRRQVLEIHEAHIQCLDILLDEVAKPCDFHSRVIKLPWMSHSTMSIAGLWGCKTLPLQAHHQLREAFGHQCSAAKVECDSAGCVPVRLISCCSFRRFCAVC